MYIQFGNLNSQSHDSFTAQSGIISITIDFISIVQKISEESWSTKKQQRPVTYRFIAVSSTGYLSNSMALSVVTVRAFAIEKTNFKKNPNTFRTNCNYQSKRSFKQPFNGSICLGWFFGSSLDWFFWVIFLGVWNSVYVLTLLLKNIF